MKGYYPDISYIDEKNRIFIDIEIDEPYSFTEKKAIHHFEKVITPNNKESFVDTNKKRDDALKNYGWTVIRFSEDQVLQNAKECVDLINLLVDYWSDGYVKPREIEHSEFSQKRWTNEEALMLAKLSYREAGIDKKMKEYIKKEALMQYDANYELPRRY